MRTVRVERTIAAPIAQVFEMLTDHANYSQFPGVRSSELLREGSEEPTGAGARRRIAYGPIRFEEDIVEFERPTSMGYVIREVNLPLDHHGGTMRFEEQGAATRVVWESTFRLTTPVVGGALTSAGAPIIANGFRRILSYADRELR
jgi:uncharacterized protein YndB with AHSA1/START domain